VRAAQTLELRSMVILPSTMVNSIWKLIFELPRCSVHFTTCVLVAVTLGPLSSYEGMAASLPAIFTRVSTPAANQAH
jgi:hypothetical protein